MCESEPSEFIISRCERMPEHARRAGACGSEDIADVYFDGATSEVAATVHNAIDAADARRKKEEIKELDGRRMDTSACHQQTAVRVCLHEGGATTPMLLTVEASISFQKLKEAIKARCGGERLGVDRAVEIKVYWIDEARVVPLDLTGWHRLRVKLWCAQPWELHVHGIVHGSNSDAKGEGGARDHGSAAGTATGGSAAGRATGGKAAGGNAVEAAPRWSTAEDTHIAELMFARYDLAGHSHHHPCLFHTHPCLFHHPPLPLPHPHLPLLPSSASQLRRQWQRPHRAAGAGSHVQ